MPDDQATPEEKINAEVTADQTLHTLAGLFGTNFDAQAGGGPAGGQWVFTDLAELDKIIGHWSDISDTLATQVTTIARTARVIHPPADDMMSVIQARAFVSSLYAMRQHADAMRAYADAYLRKLKQARSEYAITEQNNTTLFNGPHG